MTAKILAVAVTVLLNIVAALVILFVLLLALNGYGESDATWGLITFAVLAIAITSFSGAIALVLVRFFSKRNYRGPGTTLISMVIASVLGAVLQLGACLAAVLITETIRVNL